MIIISIMNGKDKRWWGKENLKDDDKKVDEIREKARKRKGKKSSNEMIWITRCVRNPILLVLWIKHRQKHGQWYSSLSWIPWDTKWLLNIYWIIHSTELMMKWLFPLLLHKLNTQTYVMMIWIMKKNKNELKLQYQCNVMDLKLYHNFRLTITLTWETCKCLVIPWAVSEFMVLNKIVM